MKNTMHMNIFVKFIFISLLSFSLSAIEPWKELWHQAEVKMEKGNDQQALKDLYSALSIMTKEEIKANSFLYLLIAEINIESSQYEEALKNVSFAEGGNLNLDDKQKASMLKVISYMFLGREEDRKKEIEHFKEIFTIPKFDIQDSLTIIRNVPSASCAKNIITNFLIGSKLCESKEDILFTKNGTCFATRKTPCDCGCGGQTQKGVGNCDWWCDKSDVLGQQWCFNHISKAWCKAACILVVQGMSETCHFCCKGGGFYQNCVEPFAHIAEKIGEGCNPDMD